MAIQTSEISRVLKEQIQNYQKALSVQETGQVLAVGDGVCQVYGLKNVMAGELVAFSDNLFGMVFNLEKTKVGVVILGDDKEVFEGMLVRRTKKIVQVPVGKPLLGRVVNVLGQALDGLESIQSDTFLEVERPAPWYC